MTQPCQKQGADYEARRRQSRRQYMFAMVIFMLSRAGQGYSWPEFSAEGYFSCTSCHVSSNGGDLLTSYGRSFAEEKVAAWAREGEGQPLHGAVGIPEWLLLGGHFRHLQLNLEDAKVRRGRNFVMQRELDFGAQASGWWGYATVSSLRKESDPFVFDTNQPIVSKWLLRYDISDSWGIRLGRTMPKFGLNVPDHNAFVRSSVGLGAGSESRLVEAVYCVENLEVTGSVSAPLLPEMRIDRMNSASEAVQSTFLSVSTFLAEAHRLSLGLMQRLQATGERSTHASLSGALGLGKSFRVLSEVNGGVTQLDGHRSIQRALYFKGQYAAISGLFPAVIYERLHHSVAAETRRLERLALALSFHPRPHFELSGTYGLLLDRETYGFSNSANFIFHYWL